MANNFGEAPQLPALPASSQQLLDRLESGQFLGASRNIRQINDLFCAIANGWETTVGDDVITALLTTGDYLINTRGRNTPAIGNAIRIVLQGFQSGLGLTVADVRASIFQRRDQFNARSLRNIERMATYGANLLSHSRQVLAFDYSSTMLAICKQLATQGHFLHLIVPESRVLDGGRPIAREATALGHRVTFTVDMAFSHFLRTSDSVLIGAETIMSNGDCWNTIGSYPIAVQAQQRQVPYYVATELIKIDPSSFAGFSKQIQPHNYAQLLQYPQTFDHPDLVSVTAPDLDNVPASLITAYITPGGILSPQQIWQESRRFLEAAGVALPEEEPYT